MEQETIYKAVACPQEKLVLSFHTAGADGSSCRPSYLIGAFCARLEGLTVQQTDAGLDALEAPRPMAELACAALGDGLTPAAYAALEQCKDEKMVERAKQWRPTRGPLQNEQTIKGLYGNRFNLTASRVDASLLLPICIFYAIWAESKGAGTRGIFPHRKQVLLFILYWKPYWGSWHNSQVVQ